MPFKIHTSGLTVRIRLTPNAHSSGFHGLTKSTNGKTALKISINAVPEDGKANKKLIAFLAKTWKVPKSSMSLLSGHTHRQKVLFIEGDGQHLLQKLSAWHSDLS